MMASRNRVQLVGVLGAEPELVKFGSGQSVLKLRVVTDTHGECEWHRVTLWGPRAVVLSRELRREDTLAVEGHLRTTAYEKNGERRYSTEIVAERVFVIEPASSRKGSA